VVVTAAAAPDAFRSEKGHSPTGRRRVEGADPGTTTLSFRAGHQLGELATLGIGLAPSAEAEDKWGDDQQR
jgi:hypothetical protein